MINRLTQMKRARKTSFLRSQGFQPLAKSGLLAALLSFAVLPISAKTGTEGPKKTYNRQVLVLNFVNQRKAKNYDYLSNSIANAMVGPLQDTGSFDVLPQEQGERLAKKNNIPPEKLALASTARKLGPQADAEVVLVGNFVVIGNTMKITAEAVDTETGRVKVSKTITTKTDARMFKAIDKLAKQMAAKMAKALPPLTQKVVRFARKLWYNDHLSFGASKEDHVYH